MLDKNSINNLLIYTLVIILFILAVVIVKPIISSIIYGILLGYIFYPIYQWLLKKIKNKNITAFLVCLVVFLIIFIAASLILSSLLKQLINIYLSLQKVDMVNIIRNASPNFLSSSEISTTIASSINNYFSDMVGVVVGKFSSLILDIPIMLFRLFVVIFVFFFSLRDGEEAMKYIKSVSPLKKETQDRFFKHFKDITQSVLIGQVVVGIIQGLVAGVGYFIFGVPNALLLTLLTVVVGIIPLIGPWLIWVPVDLYLFVIGRTGAGVGLLIYGLILISWIDTVIRPTIVSRKTQINSAIVLIGMIGGLFTFGFLGFIIGPLVIAYILLVLELYKNKSIGEDLIFKKCDTS